jgi:hypothetical protein
VGINFYKKFVAESKDRDISEKVIINPSASALKSIREHYGSPLGRTAIDDIKAINVDDLLIKGETFIYDNVYAQIFLKDEVIHGFEVESKHFAKMQHSIFEKLWQESIPLSDVIDSTMPSRAHIS